METASAPRLLSASVVEAHRRSPGSTAGTIERSLAAAAGSALVARGTRHGRLVGWLAVAAGAVLIVQGLRGRSLLPRLPSAAAPREDGSIEVARSITVTDGTARLPALLHNPDRWLPGGILESVEVEGERWRIGGRLGSRSFSGCVEVQIAPDGSASWRTAPDSALPHAGTLEVRKAPNGRGSVLRVDLRLEPQGPFARALASNLRGVLERAIGHALHRLREVLEAGELARSDPQPAARPPASGTSPAGDDS